jgi:hypothetical protein
LKIAHKAFVCVLWPFLGAFALELGCLKGEELELPHLTPRSLALNLYQLCGLAQHCKIFYILTIFTDLRETK